MSSAFLERMKNRMKRDEEESRNGQFSKDEKIFKQLKEGKNVLRLVSQDYTFYTHWIAPSKYSKVKLFPDASFEGDDALRKNLFCTDYEPGAERWVEDEERSCVICELYRAVNAILDDNNSDLEQNVRAYLEDVAKACRPMKRTMFLCIDRDDPEVSPGKKGIKIVEFPRNLMDVFMSKVLDRGIDVIDADEGVDLVIEKRQKPTAGKKVEWIWTVDWVYDGKTIKESPLTEEERKYQRPDIEKMMYRKPDQELIYDKLLRDFKEMIDDARDAEGRKPQDSQDEEEGAPEGIVIPKRSKTQQGASASVKSKAKVEESASVSEDDEEDVPF